MRVPLAAALLPLLLLLLPSPATCQSSLGIDGTENEFLAREGLLAQRDSISNWADFAAATNLTGWDEATPVCSWAGVFCGTNATTASGFSVSLACDIEGETKYGRCAPTPATGTLAARLGEIPSLIDFDISGQRLRGTLPVAWGENGTFPSLKILDVSRNDLSGTLPEAWAGTFPQLGIVNASHNAFTGALPELWGVPGAFPRLGSIDVGYNQLSGSVPPSWTGVVGGFQGVYLIDMSDNRLTGTLPDLFKLPGLSLLDISGNLLTGRLPEYVKSKAGDEHGDPLPLLQVMHLQNNSITGTVPQSWGLPEVLSQLRELDLGSNNLTGPLPQRWSFQFLNNLSFAYNQLTGTIPASWGFRTSFPDIQSLDVTGNLLCGTVPAGLPRPVCADGTDNCVTGRVCAPAPPPFPVPAPAPPLAPILPAPAPPSPPPPSNEEAAASSANIGAIVGGVAGGLVVVVILAFLALRPVKGWLRRKPPAEGLAGGGSSKVSSKSGVPGATWSEDSTTALAAFSGSLNSVSLESDPVFLYIQSHLASIRLLSMAHHPSLARQGSAPAAADVHPSTTSGSNSLAPDVQQWEVQWEDIRVVRPIGRGSFGRVYLASWRQTPVAVKVLTNADDMKEENFILPESVLKELQEEASVMTRMRHPNVVSFMGLSLIPPLIVTEFCDKGSLYDVLRRASRHADKAAELTWQLRIQMALDAARGLLYLHRRSPPIIHRDVKSPNILVDQHWRAKIADFNLSKILGAAGDTEGPTNPIWLAPEIALNDAEATAASDVYSFGMVLYELLTWKLPWEGYNAFQIMYSLMQGQRPEVPPRLAMPGPDTLGFSGLDALCHLMRECWAEEPGNRPTFDDIVPRLNDMLKRMNHVSSGASQDKQRSGSQRMDEGEESGSPIKRWGTAPVF